MTSDQQQRIRIATRSSRLALWQAHHVRDLLQSTSPESQVEIVHVNTSGDQDQQTPLAAMGGLGVFTREVQKAVLDGRADLAVHSLKDLPTEPTENLRLAAVPTRADVFDVLVLPRKVDKANDSLRKETEILTDPQQISNYAGLPEGARVGTGSLRRRAQLLHWRPDLQLLDIRGNVETRLRKLDEGEYDALCLAAAGLRRLELGHRVDAELRPPMFFPAVSQGALGLECRDDDQSLIEILGRLTCPNAGAATLAERTLLAELRAGCHAPVGVYSRQQENQLEMEAVVLSSNGESRLTGFVAGDRNSAETLGKDLAAQLLEQGAEALISGG